MGYNARLLAAAGSFVLILGACPAQAQVVPGDTFSFDLAGFNSARSVGFFVAGPRTAVFGTTQTFTGAGVNGQDITIASSETIGATSNTATFTISTPTNFLTTDTINGTTITLLQFDIGNANSGSNMVNFVLPITSFNDAGSATYNGGELSLTPATTISGNGLSMSEAEAVTSDPTPISQFGFRSFTYTITYSNAVAPAVPEPETWAMMLAGFAAVSAMMRYRPSRAMAKLTAGQGATEA